MSIALFRLRKLTVAMPLWHTPVVRNFSPLQIRDLRISREADGSETVTVYFTNVIRPRHNLVLHSDEIWEFRKTGYRIIHRSMRNGRVIQERVQHIPPLQTAIWAQFVDDREVWQQFEQEQTARCVAEQYLYKHVPNPEQYRIVTFDFNPLVAPENGSVYTSDPVRPLEEAMAAAKTDRSEDADTWIKLMMEEA